MIKQFILLCLTCLLLQLSNLYPMLQVQPDSIDNNKSFIDSANLYIPAAKFTYSNDLQTTYTGELPYLNTKIKAIPAIITGSLYVGAVVALAVHQNNVWWSGDKTPFHFQEDFVSALQVDKAGHAYGSFMLCYFMNHALITSGVGYDASAIAGTALGLLYQTYVETQDGLARDWGFSPSDWYFDALGSIFYLAQHYSPALQNIVPKWQYVPSEYTGKPVINRPRTFVDDYNSSTMWYSVNVYNLLPNDYKKYWPDWLNIAFGFGADAIDAVRDPNASPDQLSKRRYVIGLDYNIVRLLPDGGTFWNFVKQSFNFMKFPAPTLEFTPSGTRFYLAYPFEIRF